MGILDGKVAIVTGGGQNLGRAEAIALAKEGAKVTICGRRQHTLDKVVEEIAGFGGEALAVVCDVGKRDQVDKVVEATVQKFGGVNILVNNAQTTFQATALEDWTEEMHRAVWESGYLGSVHFMMACLPYLKENHGRIINTISGVGYGNVWGFVGYGATKEAIRALTRTAAREWGKYGIRVHALAPVARTSEFDGKLSREQEEQILSTIPLHEWGRPEEDIGRVVVFLSGPDSAYMTGSPIVVDGGACII